MVVPLQVDPLQLPMIFRTTMKTTKPRREPLFSVETGKEPSLQAMVPARVLLMVVEIFWIKIMMMNHTLKTFPVHMAMNKDGAEIFQPGPGFFSFSYLGRYL
jgi:hypothetical protein